MRAIMVMYDSLNRAMLEPYGCDWTKTPNFLRLARYAGPEGAAHRTAKFPSQKLGTHGTLR